MAVAAMAKGAFNYVEKPYADDALVQLMQRALERRKLKKRELEELRRMIDSFAGKKS